jgi:hypothetical protein
MKAKLESRTAGENKKGKSSNYREFVEDTRSDGFNKDQQQAMHRSIGAQRQQHSFNGFTRI